MDYQQGTGGRSGGGGRGRGGRSSGSDASSSERSDDSSWQQVGGSRRGGRGRGAPLQDRGGYDASSGGGGRGSSAPPPNRGGYDGGRGSGGPPPNRGGYEGGRGGERGSGGPPNRGGYDGGRGGGWGSGGPPPYRGGYDGGRGGGRGSDYDNRKGPQAPRGQPSSSSGSSAGPLALQLAKLKISPKLEVLDGKRVPMQRPDNGGTLNTASLNLSVNHFQLKFDKTFCILHYEIDIELQSKSKLSDESKVSKSDLTAIKKQVFKDRGSSLPDDGGRNIFSPVKLQEGKFSVVVHGTSYIVSVVLRKKLSIGDLASAPFPREILQGLDVIMRMNSARLCIQVGRNFFMPNLSTNIGRGALALEGFQQSIKPTENGLAVCVDYSVMAFRNPVYVIDFLKDMGFSISEGAQLHARERADVERALKNMRVVVTHRRSSQKFQIQGLTAKSCSGITFFDESLNKDRSLLEYYRSTYHIDIRYKNLPCLSLSKTKTNYVPMELCKLIEGQLFPKEKLDKYGKDKLKNMAVAPPRLRMNKILDMVNAEDGPCRGRILDEFHLTVKTSLTDVTARILERPTLKLLNANGNASKFNIPNNDCQWNLLKNKMLYGKKIDRWAILDLSRRQQPRRNDRWFEVKEFIPDLVMRCRDLGVPMNESPLFVEQSTFDVLDDPDRLRRTLQNCKEKAGGSLQLLVCPMLDKSDGYKTLKLVCETELGIVTQCLIPSNIKGKDQYLANLVLKINAKLGGSNFELFDSLPGVDPNRPILFVGADVNHPSARNTSSPSIAAVVASMNWPALNNYASIVQAQKHRKENIVDIGRMFRQLLERFCQINRVRPFHIIYFRDGVSDSQFDMVLNQELTDIKEAIESTDYKPKITLIVAQKRHQTRLFPKDNNGPLSTRSGNVPPGTVVDRGITAPISFNFYLCSHNGLLGTSKPTHYYVLWDEFGYTSDGIQQLIYNLCFTFARCTKPVSLVPPVYYADLLAYRGRIYHEGMMGVPSSATGSSSSSTSANAEPVKLPELHVDIKDVMFFL